MSINLHCNKVDLWQTPTYVTYMCLMTPKGVEDAKGAEAVRALKCYVEWAGSLLPHHAYRGGSIEEQENNDFRERLNDHIAEINAAIKQPKTLEVYYL